MLDALTTCNGCDLEPMLDGNPMGYGEKCLAEATLATFGEPIYTYTAEQAVEDGQLFRVPADLAPRATYLTASVVGLCTPPKGSCEDFTGRVADVLTMTRLAFSRGDQDDRMRTGIVVKIGARNVTLWAVIDGAGLTIMQPEDY